MLDGFVNIEQNMNQYFNVSHQSLYERNINDISKNEELIQKIANLGAAKAFFETILEHHDKMNLTDASIDHMLEGFDVMIDEFMEIIENKSSNPLEDEYYILVNKFVDISVQTQTELGFYKVERQAV